MYATGGAYSVGGSWVDPKQRREMNERQTQKELAAMQVLLLRAEEEKAARERPIVDPLAKARYRPDAGSPPTNPWAPTRESAY